MKSTIFFTVFSGVITYIVGQLILKLWLEPIHDMKKTIGQISYSLIESANVIGNPGVPSQEIMSETSKNLRKLASQLQSHLYLVPIYALTAIIFKIPRRNEVLMASKALIGLSNSVFSVSENTYESNAKRVATVCDSLSIYLAEDERWPK